MQNEISKQITQSASKIQTAVDSRIASNEGQAEIRKQIEVCQKFIEKESAKRDDIRPESARAALIVMKNAESRLMSLLIA